MSKNVMESHQKWSLEHCRMSETTHFFDFAQYVQFRAHKKSMFDLNVRDLILFI